MVGASIKASELAEFTGGSGLLPGAGVGVDTLLCMAGFSAHAVIGLGETAMLSSSSSVTGGGNVQVPFVSNEQRVPYPDRLLGCRPKRGRSWIYTGLTGGQLHNVQCTQRWRHPGRAYRKIQYSAVWVEHKMFYHGMRNVRSKGI